MKELQIKAITSMVHVYFTRVEPRGPLTQLSFRLVLLFRGLDRYCVVWGIMLGFVAVKHVIKHVTYFLRLIQILGNFFFWEKIFFHRKKLYLIN